MIVTGKSDVVFSVEPSWDLLFVSSKGIMLSLTICSSRSVEDILLDCEEKSFSFDTVLLMKTKKVSINSNSDAL